MSTDVIPLPFTGSANPAAALKDRRRREPRDATPSSTNPNAQESHAEAQARSAAEPTAPEVRASNPPPDAPTAERNGEADPAITRARLASRTPKPRSKTNGNGNGDDDPPSANPSPTADAVLTRLAVIGAMFTVALSVVVLGISMPHLASGVSKITACQFYTAVFMAVVFDLSQIAAEYAVIVLPLLGIANRRLHFVCAVIVLACTCVSITLNIDAFRQHATTQFQTMMAVIWGICLPVLVLLLVYVASSFVMRLHGRPASSVSRVV